MLSSPVPLALIDDHTLFRNALADMLAGDPRFQVVLQAAHGAEYLRAVQDGVQVSVAVVDLHMPVMDGFETIAWMRDHAPGTRALALSFDLTAEVRTRALKAGACGFLRKDTSKNQFLDALMQVALVGQLAPEAEPLEARNEVVRRRSELLAKLSQRELEYVRLLCANGDLTAEALAALMNVGVRTVDGYREGAYRKCNVHSRAGLVALAYKWGLYP